MKQLIIGMLILVGFIACNAQNNKKTSKSDTTNYPENAPNVTTKVNRKFDDKGNMINYDSSFIWSYSSSGNSHTVEADSVMIAFKRQFDSSFPTMFRNNFGDPVWNDSFFFRDFASSDYFMQKWHEHYFNMENMMRQMDSLRNSFITNHYPGLSSKHPD
jgi:hypothetical protein